MKNIKILSAGLASLMAFLAGSVFAENKILLDIPTLSGKTVTITGNVSAPNEKIYIEVTRKDAGVLEAKEVYAAYQVISDENGEFSYEYNMPEMSRKDNTEYSDGYFTVHAFGTGYDKGSVDFSYVSENGRKNFFENLNKSMEAEDSLYSFFENDDNRVAFLVYDILIDEIDGYSEDFLEKMCKILVDTELSFDEENISDINEFVYLMRLNGITDEDKAEELLKSDEIATRCNLTYKDIEFDALEKELSDWFLKLFVLKSKENGFESFKQAEELFKEAYILNEVNKAHYSDLYDVLYKNKSELDLEGFETLDKIEDMTDSKKQSVMQAFKEKTGEVVSIADLKDGIEKAYESYKSKSQSNGSGSGGGSGTGGGGSKNSGGSYIAGNINTMTNEESEKRDAIEGKVYFKDIENHGWAKEYINKLAANGIVSGDGNGEFAPERKVTRAEFLKMLLGALDLVSDDAECSFSDVLKTDWSYPYVASAYEQGITSGIDEVTFGKDNFITRQEAAAFMHRAAVRTFIPMDIKQSTEFSDEEQFASWAKRSINILAGAGFINGVGDNRFEPEGFTTRAQAAKMVCSLFDLI